MSRPAGNGDFARGAGAAAAKGAVLIGLAVLVGVFLLQRADTGNAGSTAATTPKKHTTRTTTTIRHPRSSTTSSSTVPAAPLKTPDQLKLIVLNGGAPTGAAAQLRSKLQQVGYTNQSPAGTWSGHHQTGTTILCKPGFAREAVALSQQTALRNAKVPAFPNPAPPSSSDVDCVVVVGA